MATNVTVHAVDGPVVIYLQDGTAMELAAQETKSLQLIEGGFCTISDVSEDEEGEEESEHPPPGYALADAMIEFWNRMKQRWQDAVGGKPPTATPL